jgi:hypothetical protein
MLKEKLPIFLINTLLLHIPLLALTDGWNYRGTNTLAAGGLEELIVNLLLKENSYVRYIILNQSLILELKFVSCICFDMYYNK